jgi:transposase
MTRRTQGKNKVRMQRSPAYKAEALGLAEKVGVAQAAAELGLHDSQLYDW